MLLLPTALAFSNLEWLSVHAVGLGDRVAFAGSSVVAARDLVEGEAALELGEGCCLTARVAYADREFGRDLDSIAARVGPGFDTVALAAFLAAERVRNFEAETWYAGSAAEQVGMEGARRASAFSPLTRAHWQAEALRPSLIDAEVLPVVQQGEALIMPLLELAARRAWVPGSAPAPPMLSDEWVRQAASDDSVGCSRVQLEQLLRESFALVLARQWTMPPPYLPLARESGGVRDAATIRPSRWGYREGAPAGPALLPPLEGLLIRSTPSVQLPITENLGELSKVTATAHTNATWQSECHRDLPQAALGRASACAVSPCVRLSVVRC